MQFLKQIKNILSVELIFKKKLYFVLTFSTKF